MELQELADRLSEILQIRVSAESDHIYIARNDFSVMSSEYFDYLDRLRDAIFTEDSNSFLISMKNGDLDNGDITFPLLSEDRINILIEFMDAIEGQSIEVPMWVLNGLHDYSLTEVNSTTTSSKALQTPDSIANRLSTILGGPEVEPITLPNGDPYVVIKTDPSSITTSLHDGYLSYLEALRDDVVGADFLPFSIGEIIDASGNILAVSPDDIFIPVSNELNEFIEGLNNGQGESWQLNALRDFTADDGRINAPPVTISPLP